MDKRLPGDWDINDFNGDGVINNFDSEPFGYTQNPQFTYNATFGFSYKNFDIMVQFFAVRNITLSPYLVSPSMIRYTAVSAEYRDYWTAENTDAFYKAPRVTTSSSTGDFLNWDASMTRLKSAEISYRLPAKLTKRLGILSTRVYISGNNLILWSKFPEDRETGSVSYLNSYPAYKTIDMGIDVTF